jgi:hypothetical protein
MAMARKVIGLVADVRFGRIGASAQCATHFAQSPLIMCFHSFDPRVVRLWQRDGLLWDGLALNL